MADGDKILIRELKVDGIIGINDWERHTKQPIVINITLFADLSRAGASDRIEDSIDYRTLTKAVLAYVESSSHFLVEALAAAVARMAVVEFGANRVVVRVEKPGALRFAQTVGVEIERSRADFEGARIPGESSS